jgi:predicted secreted protein
MQISSIIAIYLLFWVISAFVMLPLGLKTSDELGQEKVRGQADSAPANFRPLRVIVRTTILAAFAFALFYANFTYGWIGPDDVNVFGKPPGAE